MRLQIALTVVALACGFSCSNGSRAIATKIAAPAYPPLALSASVSSDVEVLLRIDPSGKVNSAECLRGHPLLQPSAQSAAEQWAFEPGRGERRATLTFSFEMRSAGESKGRVGFVFVPPYRVEIFGPVARPTINY